MGVRNTINRNNFTRRSIALLEPLSMANFTEIIAKNLHSTMRIFHIICLDKIVTACKGERNFGKGQVYLPPTELEGFIQHNLSEFLSPWNQVSIKQTWSSVCQVLETHTTLSLCHRTLSLCHTTLSLCHTTRSLCHTTLSLCHTRINNVSIL